PTPLPPSGSSALPRRPAHRRRRPRLVPVVPRRRRHHGRPAPRPGRPPGPAAAAGLALARPVRPDRTRRPRPQPDRAPLVRQRGAVRPRGGEDGPRRPGLPLAALLARTGPDAARGPHGTLAAGRARRPDGGVLLPVRPAGVPEPARRRPRRPALRPAPVL